jgi:serine/threonine-protein kinase
MGPVAIGPPPRIGRYEARRELGRGMMGVVYEAHDPTLGREIALKVIQTALGATDDERKGYERRFFAEARAAARLTHSGIVVVHDVGRDDATGTLYMALELLRGQPLDDVLRKRSRLPWQEALEIARRVAEALHHAHANGVVHRDIKPANIMLLDSGEPKIMDFGIAKVEASTLTASGQFLGTPLYMSPEQALAHPVDARSDVFSLGAVLYEMLTGQQAFAGESVTKILFQIMSREPDPPTALVTGLPPGVDYVLSRSLAKDKSVRYPDGQTLALDLDDILQGRPPRGMPGWRPATASGTMVAPVAALGTLKAPPVAARATSVPAPAPVVQSPKPPAPRAAVRKPGAPRRGAPTAAIVLIGALVVVAVGAAVAYMLRRGAPSPAAAGPAASDAAPDVKPAAPEPAKERTTGPPHMLVDFEHSLKGGEFRLWIDDEPIIDEPFGGRVTKEIAGLKLRKGRLSDTLEVKPGIRQIKVQVDWEDNHKVESIRGNFKTGGTYRLKARLGSLGGLRKDLSLEWN